MAIPRTIWAIATQTHFSQCVAAVRTQLDDFSFLFISIYLPPHMGRDGIEEAFSGLELWLNTLPQHAVICCGGGGFNVERDSESMAAALR